MKVEIHRLFDYLLGIAGDAPPDCAIGLSLAPSPRLGAYLADLDPDLALDWNGVSFQGLPELRRLVLDQAGLTGVLSPEDVLVTAGAAEANYLIFRQLVRAGDEVVTDSPGWPQAGVMAKAIGARLVEVPRDEAAGWALDPDRVAAAMTRRTRLVFLTNPNNPTGRLIPEADLRTITAAADHVGAHLLVDEVYAGLEWDAPRPPAVAGLSQRGITTGSVSKALGLQGLRTGWIITPDRALLRDAMILRENASEIMNILGETIAAIALRPDRYRDALQAVRNWGRSRLLMLDAFVTREAAHLTWTTPEAGLIGLGRLAKGDGDGLAARLLASPFRTFLLPGSSYGCPDHIRLGVGGAENARLEEGLRRLSAALHQRQP